MHISDGLSLASMRSSTINNNIATAVVRLEGRTWVLDAAAFLRSTEALDADLYRLVEDTSEESFKVYQLPRYHNQQVRKGY